MNNCEAVQISTTKDLILSLSKDGLPAWTDRFSVRHTPLDSESATAQDWLRT